MHGLALKLILNQTTLQIVGQLAARKQVKWLRPAELFIQPKFDQLEGICSKERIVLGFYARFLKIKERNLDRETSFSFGASKYHAEEQREFTTWVSPTNQDLKLSMISDATSRHNKIFMMTEKEEEDTLAMKKVPLKMRDLSKASSLLRKKKTSK